MSDHAAANPLPTANGLGVAALVLWSMNIALTRHIGEAHALGMPAVSFTASGLALILLDALRRRRPPWKSDASSRYWTLGGSAYVAYLLLYTLSLAWATSRTLALPLGLINYQWASLTLILMPFFFACRVSWPVLGAGVALCLAGISCALLWDAPLSELSGLLAANALPLAMMAIAAFLWAFYSNAAKKWGGAANGAGWFQLAAGLCFLVLWLRSGDPLGLTRDMTLPLAVHSLVINAAAYLLWDVGVRRGSIALLGALANYLPIASVLFGAWYLDHRTTPGLWIGCALVTAGALLCRRGAR